MLHVPMHDVQCASIKLYDDIILYPYIVSGYLSKLLNQYLHYRFFKFLPTFPMIDNLIILLL